MNDRLRNCTGVSSLVLPALAALLAIGAMACGEGGDASGGGGAAGSLGGGAASISVNAAALSANSSLNQAAQYSLSAADVAALQKRSLLSGGDAGLLTQLAK